MHRQILPYCVNKTNWITAVVATNLAPVGVRFVLTYRSDNGTVIESKVHTLAPYALQIFVPAVFGWFSVECESNQSIALQSIYKSKATDEWAVDSGIRIDQYITRTDNRNLAQWPDGDEPYWKFTGKLDLLQVRHLTALRLILKRFWHVTGLTADIQDLNSKTQSVRHPSGTHVGSDADFGYFDDLSKTWALWEELLAVFTDAIIMTHSKIWFQMADLVPRVRLAALGSRILRDENPTWNHDTHFHLRIAADISGAVAGVDWEKLY